MNPLYPLRPGEQDCRDFLRTGRCKYGDSCKYNHPLNVESGGGLSDGGPLPSRPGEAPCHYFLKHGICKFGQSCKFDHPSGVERGTAGLAASNNNMGGTGTGGGQTAVASSSGVVYVTDPATGATTVQVLPQRPNEPDCIYFLRNGRCKYGSICKFHHPLPGSTQTTTIRQVGQIPAARPQVQVQQGVTYALAPQTVAYVQQSPQRLQPIREQVQPQQATHVLLPDGQIAVILDPQSLQNVRELNVQDRPKFYLSQANGTVGSLTSVEQNKNANRTVQVQSPVLTATTTASSTNNSTIGSNHDLWGTTVRVPHKSTSGGSLSIESGYPYQGDPIHPSQSQVSFRTSSTSSPDEFLGSQQDDMRARASSLGSGTLDQQGYYWPSNSSMASVQTDHGPIGAGFRSAPGSGGVANRSTSFDIAERTSSFSAPPNGHRHQHTPSSDEGLSKMTSSLLTLIDRPIDGDVTPNAANTTYIRPPPGMMMNQTVQSQIDNSSESSSGGGNGNASYPYSYFVGGYDQTPRF